MGSWRDSGPLWLSFWMITLAALRNCSSHFGFLGTPFHWSFSFSANFDYIHFVYDVEGGNQGFKDHMDLSDYIGISCNAKIS